MSAQISKEQYTAAKVAGALYLALGALAAFAEFYVRSGILVYGNDAQTAHNILESERLFRLGMVCDLLNGAGDAALAIAFYALLKPISRPLALLAAFWRLGESIILGYMTVTNGVVLVLLRQSARFSAFSSAQLHSLAGLYLDTQRIEYGVGLVFYSLGSTLFCYLLVRSRYIPRILSGWGLVASVLALASTLVLIVFPNAASIAPACYVPVGLFEIVTGVWLLTAGVKLPRSTPITAALN